MIKTAIQIATAFALLLTISGCATDRSESDFNDQSGQVLSTTETAPADLQLTCSSAAASQFSLPPDNVLPVSSSKLPDGNYQVQLTSNGSNFQCTVDSNANIISLIPA